MGHSSVQSWFGKVEFELYEERERLILQPDGSAKVVSVEPIKKLKVICPSTFIKNWIEVNYFNVLSQVVSTILSEIEIEFYLNLKKNQEPTAPKKSLGNLSKISTPLNPKLTFENFIVDPSNEFAFRAIRNSKQIFLTGESGNGKTHLGQALVKLAISEGLQTCYIHTQEYAAKFITAIRENTLLQFKQNFYNIDLLVIDDIQFMKNKRATQELFLEILMHLLTHNKRLIMIGDSYNGLSDKIISYINGGLCARIGEPSGELKFKILKDRAKEKLNEEIIDFIVKNLEGSIRELEGAILRIKTHIDFFGSSVDLKNINQLLYDLHIYKKREISTNDLLTAISEFYGISLSQLISKGRSSIFSHARSIAMFMLRDLLKKSLLDIGQIFGNTSHTNALQNIRKIENRFKENVYLRNEIEGIKAKLNER